MDVVAYGGTGSIPGRSDGTSKFMKRNLTVVAALLIAALCHARDVRSLNGRYAIRAENSISLVDFESGSTLLVLDKDASGESRVEVAWAPNSMKVAIVEDDARGSVAHPYFPPPRVGEVEGASFGRVHNNGKRWISAGALPPAWGVLPPVRSLKRLSARCKSLHNRALQLATAKQPTDIHSSSSNHGKGSDTASF